MEKNVLDLLPQKVMLTGNLKNQIVTVSGKQLFSDRSQKLCNHSPDGFNWGYGGSGPAQLSLAILLEFMPESLAMHYHQGFKWAVIAKLPKENFAQLIDIRAEIKKLYDNEVQKH